VEATAPPALFTSGNGYQKSERSLAGPLRMGTARGVGPNGPILDGASDMGMDRISPRRFDPIGNSINRGGDRERSSLISRELRNRGR
jgi:hypothetical protein